VRCTLKVHAVANEQEVWALMNDSACVHAHGSQPRSANLWHRLESLLFCLCATKYHTSGLLCNQYSLSPMAVVSQML